MKKIIDAFGYRISKVKKKLICDPHRLGKARIFVERYREIISDPLNILIDRIPESGFIDNDGCVILHNGNRVPVFGKFAYYSEFSDILIINRGVHEPLEEFCFQFLLKKIKNPAPLMFELGAYWAHYSMWLKKFFPNASCLMVEPDSHNLEVGKRNFELNGYTGTFLNSLVGINHFRLDDYAAKQNIAKLDILHSDIQGFEMEMLQGAKNYLSEGKVDYVFISTHSDQLHNDVLDTLVSHGYRIEISSPVDVHTTSGDGFVLASSPNVDALFNDFLPLGRIDIARSKKMDLVSYLNRVASIA
jgi:hypothetical protein